MPASPVSHPWLRFLRFSVRRLIVVVLVIGAGLGWFVREAEIQRDAVAAIERSGGGVSYQWEWREWKSIPRGKPWAPKWLVDRIGVDYFGHVTSVGLSPTETDSAITHVGHLTQLQRLTINGSSVSDAGLTHLKGLTTLSVLGLGNTQVTDAGLAHLKCAFQTPRPRPR